MFRSLVFTIALYDNLRPIDRYRKMIQNACTIRVICRIIVHNIRRLIHQSRYFLLLFGWQDVQNSRL